MVDALAASPVLYRKAAPMLLVQPGQAALPAAVVQGMQAAGIRRAVVLGGPAAVDPAVFQQLAGILGSGAVIRLGGATRNGTAVAIDQLYFSQAPAAVISANGTGGGTFVDALAASAVAAENDVPIVLANPTGLPPSSARYLATLHLEAAWVMGGEAALTSAVTREVTALIAPLPLAAAAASDRTPT